jgi:hypothetical protein
VRFLLRCFARPSSWLFARAGLKKFVENADSLLLDDTQAISEEDVAREEVAAYPPRTLAHPYVSEKPVSCPALSFEEVASSCIITSTLFKLETPDTVLDDFVLPIDDSIDPNTYVGAREHQLYWAKSELGIFVTAVAKNTLTGHPTLSLGPNGYHFAYLPTGPDVIDFPKPKALAKVTEAHVFVIVCLFLLSLFRLPFTVFISSVVPALGGVPVSACQGEREACTRDVILRAEDEAHAV